MPIIMRIIMQIIMQMSRTDCYLMPTTTQLFHSKYRLVPRMVSRGWKHMFVVAFYHKMQLQTFVFLWRWRQQMCNHMFLQVVIVGFSSKNKNNTLHFSFHQRRWNHRNVAQPQHNSPQISSETKNYNSHSTFLHSGRLTCANWMSIRWKAKSSMLRDLWSSLHDNSIEMRIK